MKKINSLLFIVILLTACSVQPTITTTPTIAPSLTIPPSSTPSSTTTASPSPTPSLDSMNEFMKGYTYGGGYRSLSSLTSDWILANEVKPLSVNWIKINQFCWQQTDATTTIDCTSVETPTDADLNSCNPATHSHGIRVMLELAMVIRDGSNGGWAARSAGHLAMMIGKPGLPATIRWFFITLILPNKITLIISRSGLSTTLPQCESRNGAH